MTKEYRIHSGVPISNGYWVKLQKKRRKQELEDAGLSVKEFNKMKTAIKELKTAVATLENQVQPAFAKHRERQMREGKP